MCQFQLASMRQYRGQRWLWWKLVSGGGVKNRGGGGRWKGGLGGVVGCSGSRTALKTNLLCLSWMSYSSSFGKRRSCFAVNAACFHQASIKKVYWSGCCSRDVFWADVWVSLCIVGWIMIITWWEKATQMHSFLPLFIVVCIKPKNYFCDGRGSSGVCVM